MNNNWKDIKDFEGLYQINQEGVVKSLPKKKGFLFTDEKTMKARIIKEYYQISLCKNNKRYDRKIHRLVAQAFIPNPENKPQVNHIDGNKLNNNVENLEWCTAKENAVHASRTGLSKSGQSSIRSKYKNIDIENVINLLNEGTHKLKSISKITGVDEGTIYKVHKKESWVGLSEKLGNSGDNVGKMLHNKRKYSEEFWKNVYNDRQQRMSVKNLCDKYDANRDDIKNILKRFIS